MATKRDATRQRLDYWSDGVLEYWEKDQDPNGGFSKQNFGAEAQFSPDSAVALGSVPRGTILES